MPHFARQTPFSLLTYTVWLLKMVVFGVVLVAIVNSGMSPFYQALIIAVLSAVIGAVGLVCAAFVGVRASRQIERDRQRLEALRQALEESEDRS